VGLSLTAAPALVDVSGGTGERLSNVWAYNGSFPGPTIVARPGDIASITLQNGIFDETTIHWHGMLVPHAADGHPLEAIAPGETYDYDFTILPQQRATLNWYHPHPHFLTGEQVALGLAGAFLIRDADEDALGLPGGPYEVPLVIRDAKFTNRGDLDFRKRKSGFSGDTPLVNGTCNPYLEVDAGSYRFRVLNGANARVFRLALGDGAPITVIGNDGGLLPAAADVDQIEVGPGERLDILVDFSGLAAEATVALQDLDEGWDLLEFRGTGAPGAPAPDVSSLPTIVDLADPQVVREFSFDGMNRINGQEYEVERVDFEVPANQVEEWVFTTGGNAPHPVHSHGAYFQVKERTGGRGDVVFPWERGWKDTVLLQDGETVRVWIRFDDDFTSVASPGLPRPSELNPADDPGLYLLHCHQLAHEDAGMMLNFRVVEPS
jgi:FtsP/CotA-like multicopper oxidase with cupredoxin domain